MENESLSKQKYIFKMEIIGMYIFSTNLFVVISAVVVLSSSAGNLALFAASEGRTTAHAQT